MKILAVILIILVAAMFARHLFLSFRSQSPADYADTGPRFILQQHLKGRILSEGLIYGPNGKMTNSFVAEMHGEWDGDTGSFSENFTYSNGKKQQRKWMLKLGNNNTFTATADDIIGVGQGVVSGSTVMLRYKIVLPKESGGHTLDVVDWMYLTENGVILNKSEMRKFRIKVAELVATMRPE